MTDENTPASGWWQQQLNDTIIDVLKAPPTSAMIDPVKRGAIASDFTMRMVIVPAATIQYGLSAVTRSAAFF